MVVKFFSLFIVLGLFLGCRENRKEARHVWFPLDVTATAYNSVKSQTSGVPNITAWGDTLVPGKKSIAISHDLVSKGLKYGTMVRLKAFPDTFIVNDKMHGKWENRIDIYMGKDIARAKKWGKRKVRIEFAVLIKNLDTLAVIP